jgi:hypothetical protein
MDVDAMMLKVLSAPYAMVRESSFPYLHRAAQSFSYGMRVPTFNELHYTLQRDPLGRQQQMKMLRHKHKRVKPELSLAPIRVESLEKEPCHRFCDEQTSSLPGRRGYEISARRRDCARGFQQLTSAAEAALVLRYSRHD